MRWIWLYLASKIRHTSFTGDNIKLKDKLEKIQKINSYVPYFGGTYEYEQPLKNALININ